MANALHDRIHSPTSTDLASAAPQLIVRPWEDPVVEACGHPIDGRYVELFWLGILGPTATWLLRRLAAGLEEYPDGYELDLAQTAASLGLSLTPGRHGPFSRALDRCVRFGMAYRGREHGQEALAVRRKAPPLAARQVERLPAMLRTAHRDWLGLPEPTTGRPGREATPPG